MQLAHAGRRAELEHQRRAREQVERRSDEVVRMAQEYTTSRWRSGVVGVLVSERARPERGATGRSDVCLLLRLCLFHCRLT